MQGSNSKKHKILYIGEKPELLKQSSEESVSCEIIQAENALNAINKLGEINDFDAIISEYYLPGMNGIEIFKLLKSKKLCSDTPFILIAFKFDLQIRNKAISAKVDDLYFAPFNADDICIRIDFLNKFRKIIFKNNNNLNNQVIRDYRIPLIKRTFDILVSGFALLLLSPLLILVAIIIRLESKGKIYYTSKRVGTGYKIFDFYKFRSMFTGADAKLKELEHLNKYGQNGKEHIEFEEKCPKCAKLQEGEYCSPTLYSGGVKICEYWYYKINKSKLQSTFVKIKDDPRITKVGKFIRNTSIDELPQLINVLKGDMSIVGNRPLPLYEAELLTSDDWIERFLGPAGITGLWQVELRGKKGEMSEDERKALDNQYARNYSFLGDIKLILRTIPALFQKESV